MNNEPNLQLHFKEFIKTDSYLKGIDRIKKNPDHTCDLLVYEPKNIEEAQLGTLFMLGKIENIPQNIDFDYFAYVKDATLLIPTIIPLQAILSH